MSEPINDTETKTVEPQMESDDTVKTFTQEEVNSMISERVKREQAKNAKLLEQAKVEALEAFKKEQEEQKQLSKLSEQERMQKELEKLQKENADLLAQQQRAQQLTEARQELSKDGYAIDDAMLNIIVSNDNEATLENMNAFKAYTENLKSQWEEERAKGVTPKANVTPQTKQVTQAQFDLMSYQERVALANENPELFKRLIGGI